VALPPLKYEALRDDQRLVVEKEQEKQEKQDRADRQSQEARKTEKAAPDIDREALQREARVQVAREQAVKFERQKVDYAARQREETARKDRDARRSEYMKKHNPLEYAREEKDKARRQEWIDRSRGVAEKTRDKADSAETREPNKSKYPLSERAQALLQKTRERDAAEREDHDRSER